VVVVEGGRDGCHGLPFQFADLEGKRRDLLREACAVHRIVPSSELERDDVRVGFAGQCEQERGVGWRRFSKRKVVHGNVDEREGFPKFDYAARMAWVKVPPEHRPIFEAALPKDPRIETVKMFGGVAAKINGHVFAGLFGRSTMLLLPEKDRAEALSLPGASAFDPMGDGRARSDKVMLPEKVMKNPAELRRWIARAFEGAKTLPEKARTKAKKKSR